jgi:dienelactone hydrolase
MTAMLPDLFQFDDGRRVTDARTWRLRRQELYDQILGIEFGRLPPTPASVSGELLHSHPVRRFGQVQHCQYRLTTGPEPRYSFLIDLMMPAGDGPHPVLLDGDGCWRYITDEITAEVLNRGYLLAVFNRVEIVADIDSRARTSGLYAACPEGDYGALAAWAWGYHRAVDFLLTLPGVDAARIAVTGHSRGGKAALLAGATDERIALTAPNNSGCCGAGCLRWEGPGCETLADMLRGFPQWFGPRLREYVGREEALPFDQHSLKALVAPRALLCTEAHGDAWANPTGTWQSHRATAEVYRFLEADARLAIHFRDGVHEHNRADWLTLLDFADAQFRGRPYTADPDPYPGLPPAHHWSAPVTAR